MQIFAYSSIAIALYLIAALQQFLVMRGKFRHGKFWLGLVGCPAILVHAYLLHLWIDLEHGQNLTLFNMFSLIVWLTSLLALLFSFWRQMQGMVVILFPVAAISIILVDLFAGTYVVATRADFTQLFHIILAVLTVSVLGIAALQAIILAIQERQLRLRRASGILQKLPSLETMEELLFQIIWLGFILLTVLIATSLYAYTGQLAFKMLDKAILVCLAWVVFVILLFCRHVFGLRGRRAIYGTLIGVILLAAAYFGSQLIIELFKPERL